MILPFRQPTRENIRRDVEMDEDEPWVALREPLAVRFAQRRTRDNDGFTGFKRAHRHRSHSVEPWSPLRVRERLASSHLFHALRCVRSVCVDEPCANLSGQELTYCRLSRPSRTDQRDRVWTTGDGHRGSIIGTDVQSTN